MKFLATHRRSLSAAIALILTLSIAGCGSKEPPAATTTAAPPPPAAATTAPPPVATPAVAQAPIPAVALSPEALEELLAPIALYPDPILSQVLIASTNPQEVLDAGNWLLQNQGLTGKALDAAAAQIGFTPPVRALLQFPETVDMMCMELDWTTELGQAFVADQQGVLDAVQRLRRQAQDVGNLKSSPQMKVENQVQDGKEVVVLAPPKPDVVYVPQYDPVAVYAPAPAAAPVAAAPATTTTTTTTESSGYSTGAMVTTGLLAFGAGMLVNELFDDDDNHNHKNGYYYPNYGYGGMPYYPPYPYRPAYGNGYYPSNGYNRPPNYQHGFNNNNVVVINNGQGGDYWNDRNNRATTYQKTGTYQAKSPISSAKPNRSDLQDLNKRQPRAMPADVKRPSTAAAPKEWKGQSSYAGAKQGAKDKKVAANAPQARPAPKPQGSYGGASGDRAKPSNASYQGAANKAKPQAPQRPSTKDVSKPRPSSGQGDRGYSKPVSAPAARPQKMDTPKPAARPAQSPAKSGGGQKQSKPSAMSGSNQSGKSDRAASQRGKQSMPQGARSKGGGGGGGGGGKKGKR
jgi:predicted small lipoprotein YifL